MVLTKADIFSQLQTEILKLQGIKAATNTAVDHSLGPIAKAFPNSSFPLGVVHEFISKQREDAAAACGFMAGLMSSMMGSCGACMWISSSRTIFPPALSLYGLKPDRIIFIDVKRERDVLWVMDEALKCGALNAVVGEVSDLSFTASRRLQLAVEESRVTGLVLRKHCRNVVPTACVSRWRITPLPSESIDDLPGVGHPVWQVELLRIRNGKPGVWKVQWINGNFIEVQSIAEDENQNKQFQWKVG